MKSEDDLTFSSEVAETLGIECSVILSLYNKNLTVVFGCGGDRDVSKRSKMALIAKKFCKKIIGKNKFIKVRFYEDKIKSNKTINLINYLTKNRTTIVCLLYTSPSPRDS